MRTCSLWRNWLWCVLCCWCSMTGAGRARGRVWRCPRTGPLYSTWLLLCKGLYLYGSAFSVLYSLVLKDTITILVYSPSGREAQWLSQGSWSPCVGGVGGGCEPGGQLGVSGGGEDSARWWSGVTAQCAYRVMREMLLSAGPWGGTCSPGSANSSTASCATSLSRLRVVGLSRVEAQEGWRRERRTGVATGSGGQMDTKDSLPYFQHWIIMMVNRMR